MTQRSKRAAGKREVAERLVMRLTCLTVLGVWVWKNFSSTAASGGLLDFPTGVVVLFLGSMGLSSVPEVAGAFRDFVNKTRQ